MPDNSFLVADDTPIDTLLGHVVSTKQTAFVQQASYRMLRSEKYPAKFFRIDESSGNLYSQERLDRDVICTAQNSAFIVILEDETCILYVTVAVSNQGIPDFVDVKIFLQDSNDHRPRFPHGALLNLSISEAAKDVLHVTVQVEDYNDNAPHFVIDDKFPLDNSPDVNVSVRQHTGTFSDIEATYKLSLLEGRPINQALITFRATDNDSSSSAQSLNFAMDAQTAEVGEYFKLKASGELYLSKILDYEHQDKYAFKVLVTDNPKLQSTGIARFHTSTAQVLIQVVDSNDEEPKIEIDYLNPEPDSGSAVKYAILRENADPTQFLAHILVQDHDSDPNNSRVTCSLKFNSHDLFQLVERARTHNSVQYNL
ncbi:hypothetical protein Ciccas_014166, partial [Cichlidogyrus casuarinus]